MTGFFQQVPDEYWLPPKSWSGEVDEYDVEWLNYPPHSVQFFIRGGSDEDWMMSGGHLRGQPPPVDPVTYSELITSIEVNTEIHYPAWFLPREVAARFHRGQVFACRRRSSFRSLAPNSGPPGRPA